MKSDIDKLKVKYVSMVIETISIAFPVCINAVPAKTRTRSGYAIAAANDEFFVKILLTLALCISDDGFLKLRTSLLNY